MVRSLSLSLSLPFTSCGIVRFPMSRPNSPHSRAVSVLKNGCFLRRTKGIHAVISPAAGHSGWEDHWQSDQVSFPPAL
jgi:hypothetical protein